jgi:hypothetical protein
MVRVSSVETKNCASPVLDLYINEYAQHRTGEVGAAIGRDPCYLTPEPGCPGGGPDRVLRQ